jgi:hypothetical protein
MGWERRRNNRCFYYRVHRCGDRIVKEYLGSGAKAQQAAAADAAARQTARETLSRRRGELSILISLAGDLQEIEKLTNPLLTAQFLGLGWTKHHRQWRPKK